MTVVRCDSPVRPGRTPIIVCYLQQQAKLTLIRQDTFREETMTQRWFPKVTQRARGKAELIIILPLILVVKFVECSLCSRIMPSIFHDYIL